MTQNRTSGRAPGISMADFNARAKKIAATTGEIQRGDTGRARPSRFRRDAQPATKVVEPREPNES